jgi:hypothetical protein
VQLGVGGVPVIVVGREGVGVMPEIMRYGLGELFGMIQRLATKKV